MKKSIVAALILASTATFALAAEPDSSLSGKEMKDSPGVQGAGKTDMPNAKPNPGSVDSTEMKTPGVTNGGNTDMPNAKPNAGSLDSTEMKAPGAQK
jgi:hypothetical protein